jgi:CRISPR-associated protein (TIGR03986 family)
LDCHETEVWAFIELWRHEKNIRGRIIRFKFWNVVDLQDGTKNKPNYTPTNKRENWQFAWRCDVQPKESGWVKGYVCNTGQEKNNRTWKNIESKHDERVFFFHPDNSFNQVSIPIEDFHRNEWKRLIENYGEIHENEEPPKDDNNKPRYEWSRHVQNCRREIELKNNTLCYARVQWNENKKDFDILELSPVLISRRLHRFSPLDLLDDTLKPATGINKLSPADRVFGCVIQNSKDKKKANAYRGQIRVGAVVCGSDDAVQEFADMPLNILGQPKPQQGRFYVAEDKQGGAQKEIRNNEEAGYKKERGLRGRKVYPHHAHIEDKDFWFQRKEITFNEQEDFWSKEFTNSKGKKYYREYLRPRGLNKQTNQIEQQRDSQNRSIQGWIRPGAKFEFEIHFTNLSKTELGALVWLLRMNDGLEKADFFHRFGGGKPLGLGSVSLQLKGEEITSGADLRDFYISLDASPKPSVTAADCQAAFETELKLAYPNQNFLESFKAACKGFTDDMLPVHYPRTEQEPNAEGKNFEWFVENNKGRKLPLPNLSNEIGLPRRPLNKETL